MAEHTRNKGQHAFAVLGALAVVVVGAIGAYAYMTAGEEETDDAVIEADVVGVTARVGGAIAVVHVTDNQVVRKGDLLFTLDDADLNARLAQARADLQTATAQATGAHAQAQVTAATARGGLRGAQAMAAGSASAVQAADAQVTAARAALTRAEAEATKAQSDLTRARTLVASDAIARQQLDAAQAAFDATQAAVTQARATVVAAEEARRAAESRVAEAQARVTQSTPVNEQIAAAQAAAALADARVTAATAAVTLAELQVSYTRVHAAADGMVTQVSARPGTLVAAGQPLAQLVPIATYVVANFKETQIDLMRAGNTADVRIDAYPGTVYKATVHSLAGGTGSRFSIIPPDNASGNFVKVVQRVPVRLDWVSPPDQPLRAGLSADVTVHVSAGKGGQ